MKIKAVVKNGQLIEFDQPIEIEGEIVYCSLDKVYEEDEIVDKCLKRGKFARTVEAVNEWIKSF